MRTLIRISRCISVASQSYLLHSGIPRKCSPAFINYPVRCYCSEQSSNKNPKRIAPEENSVDDSSSSTSSSESSTSEDEGYNEGFEEEKLRSAILEAAMPFVKEYGWTASALAKGGETLGYSSMVHSMFEKGAVELVNHFYINCNSCLEKELKSSVEEREKTGERIGTTEFIRRAVETRLRMNVEYIDSWPKALVLLASPSNFSSSLNNIGTLVDTIWYYAGDRSHDFNWYTKRAMLAAVYKSTELCMLQDHSEDFQDTWNFLDRRLGEVTSFAKCMKQSKNRAEDFGSLLTAGCTTMENILGLNRKAR